MSTSNATLSFFDSYASAVENSDRPTAEFGQKQQALLDPPMSFTDVGVVEDRDLVGC
jgi:hypothetical protein